jgi:hypothetical protein
MGKWTFNLKVIPAECSTWTRKAGNCALPGAWKVEQGKMPFADCRESAALAEQSGVWLSVRAMDRGRSAALSSEPARFRVEWTQRQLKSPTGPVLAFSRAKYVAAVGEGLAPGQPVTHQASFWLKVLKNHLCKK